MELRVILAYNNGGWESVSRSPWWAVEVASWLGIAFLIWIAFWGYKQYKKKTKK